MGKLLIIIGIICIAAGCGWLALDHIGLSRFIGNLPGDINWTKDNVSFHFPIVTCLLISIVLTIIVNLFFR